MKEPNGSILVQIGSNMVSLPHHTSHKNNGHKFCLNSLGQTKKIKIFSNAQLKNNIFLLVIPFLLISLLGITEFIQPAQAQVEVTTNPTPDVPNTVTVNFADVTNTRNQSSSASLDKSAYSPGDTAIMTVTDDSANLDPANVDTLTATVSTTSGGSITLTATETDVNTGIFQASFIFTSGSTDQTTNSLHMQRGDSITINYAPLLPQYAGRLQTIVDTLSTSDASTPTGLLLQNYTLTAGDQIGCACTAATTAVEIIDAPPTITDIPNTVSVTMSYANANFGANAIAGTAHLFLYSSPVDPASGLATGPWLKETQNRVDDPGAQTITTTVTQTDPTVALAPSSGLGGEAFVLAFDTGAPGGGSSGLVSAGFVLNFIAGSSAAASDVSVSPPTFGGSNYHYTDGLTITQGSQKTIFDTSNYNQDIPTQVMVSGKKVNMNFKTFEAYNPNGVIHMGLYIIPHGQDMITTNSIGSIVYDKNSPVQISDPNHILSDATASINSDGKFQYTTFSFVPTKSYDKMSFLARAWNDHLQTTDIRVHDAIDEPAAPKTLQAGVIQYDTFNNLQAALEKDKFYKSPVMAHIHATTDVFSSDEGGQVYWLYDTINHSVTLVIADKNGNEVYSYKAALDQIIPDKKGDYGFMQFTSTQLNRNDKSQEENAMKIEEAKALLFALEHGIIKPDN